MSTINHMDLNFDSKTSNKTEENQVSKSSNKTTFIILIVISVIVVITTIILLAVFLPKKNKKTNRTNIKASLKKDNYNQSLELIVDGKEDGNKRYLQEVEMVQILGDNFDELNSINSIIYLNDKIVPFNKKLSINFDLPSKVVIKIIEKLSTFKEMFSGCNRIKEISLINVETDLVSETTSMFENCSSLTSVKFKNTSIYNITSAAKMFKNCRFLNSIDLEGFSTNNAKDISEMFKGCSSFSNTSFIESLSTKNAEYLNEMFSDCSSIKSLNLSGYNTSNAKNMSGLFKGMSNLEELELSSFQTEKVEDMSKMFENCKSLSSLDLSNFNTNQVIYMNSMFANCLKLTELIVTSFHLYSCKNTDFMFANTSRELMLSIEKNEEIMEIAGKTWSENKDEEYNITKIPLDLLFLVDATGSMGHVIEAVKKNIVYIAVNLLKKRGMKKYDLFLGAIFYRDPFVSQFETHEVFDLNENALEFKNFVNNITAKGGGDIPEDWAGALNLTKDLSWRNNSLKFIIHIADAGAHGYKWSGDNYPIEENKTDEIITYLANNNFSIAGFEVNRNSVAHKSFKRAQDLFRNFTINKKYFITQFSVYISEEDYLLNLVYDSFQNIFIYDAELIKGKLDYWYEIDVGAHYYAYAPVIGGYTKASTLIKLPDKLETNNGYRNAYISLGLSGIYYSIDTGIRNNGTTWRPYHYDAKREDFIVYDNYSSPQNTTQVKIEIEVTQEIIVIVKILFMDSNSNILKSFTEQINASHIIEYDTEKRPAFRFYRFASLVNKDYEPDTQNDLTHMLGGKFTNLTIVRDNVNYKWGIDSDDINKCWKVSYKRINLSYTEDSDTFDIYHKPPDED